MRIVDHSGLNWTARPIFEVAIALVTRIVHCPERSNEEGPARLHGRPGSFATFRRQPIFRDLSFRQESQLSRSNRNNLNMTDVAGVTIDSIAPGRSRSGGDGSPAKSLCLNKELKNGSFRTPVQQ